MMGLKVLSLWEWLISHVVLVAGLALITVGLLQEGVVVTIAGIWVLALGLCLGFGYVLRKLAAK